jgi:hypothetical protein
MYILSIERLRARDKMTSYCLASVAALLGSSGMSHRDKRANTSSLIYVLYLLPMERSCDSR